MDVSLSSVVPIQLFLNCFSFWSDGRLFFGESPVEFDCQTDFKMTMFRFCMFDLPLSLRMLPSGFSIGNSKAFRSTLRSGLCRIAAECVCKSGLWKASRVVSLWTDHARPVTKSSLINGPTWKAQKLRLCRVLCGIIQPTQFSCCFSKTFLRVLADIVLCYVRGHSQISFSRTRVLVEHCCI